MIRFFALALATFLMLDLAHARPLEMTDFAKVLSRGIQTPVNRQGTCLVFRSGPNTYCLSSYHVAYNAWDDQFQHNVFFESGETSALQWQAGDWSRGMVLLKLLNPPKRNYIQWSDIRFFQESAGPLPEGSIRAWGFPLNVNVLNEAFGQVTADNGWRFALFVFIKSFVLVEDIATEIGFSGGALVNDNGDYAGMLSHQLIENEKVLTAAIPSFEVFDWVDRHLDPFEIQNSTFFYVDPRAVESLSYTVHLVGYSIDVIEDPKKKHPQIEFKFESNPYQHLLRSHRTLERFPDFFPKEIPASISADQFEVGSYRFLGCTPYWPIFSADEVALLWNGVEMVRSMVYAPVEECGYYHLINTGSSQNLVGHQELEVLWNQSFAKMDPKEAPEWFAKWSEFWKFVSGKRADQAEIPNNLMVGLMRYDKLESLLTDPKIQNDRAYLKTKDPSALQALEFKFKEILEAHQRVVVIVFAPRLIDPKNQRPLGPEHFGVGKSVTSPLETVGKFDSESSF